MRAIARGEATPAHVHVPPDVVVKAIRRALGLSQDAFAAEFCFSLSQIRDWEQNRYRPLDGNRAYLMMIERHPDMVRNMLREMLTAARADRTDDKKVAAG
jgi:putative transcriptional regulator